MVEEFVKAWDKNKEELREYFKTTPQSEYDSYELLVKLLFEKVINPEYNDYDKYDMDIQIIDNGDYQGTLVFILHESCYQPCISEYVYTSVDYGSCSYCDTLQGISGYDYGIPSEEQVNDYMTLCLHLLQRCHIMEGENKNDN